MLRNKDMGVKVKNKTPLLDGTIAKLLARRGIEARYVRSVKYNRKNETMIARLRRPIRSLHLDIDRKKVDTIAGDT